MEVLPAGVDGELWIGGAGLARGYLGRPELTAERFRPDPFAPCAPQDGLPGDRLYRTGDLVRQLPDGNLLFRGRVDGQVKIRGFRIELGEVEAALRRLPGVREAAAVVQEDDADGARRLVAFVVPTAADLQPLELRAALQLALPEHMVPAALALLPALPLTASGKVDRTALARLASALAVEGEEASFHARPRTPVEEVLAGIWGELLRADRVGVDDDFFALGGHSLLVAQALSRIRQALGVEVPLVEFFKKPTVAELARWIEAGGRSGSGAELPPIRPLPAALREGRPLPLSFAQERVWFLDQLTPGGNLAYNFQVAIRLRGPLDVGALDRTLGEIVRRHEVLRTSFPSVAGRPVQVVHKASPLRLPRIDLSGLPPTEREERAEALIEEQIQTPFDLTRGPLIRWRLLRQDALHHTLVQVEHHFVHDGWSLAIFLRELKALYAAFSAGEPSPLPEPPVQYADYAVWQREWMEGEVMERLLGYWKGQLAGSPPALEIATDRPRPPHGSFRGDIALLRVRPELYESLRRFARRQGFTLYMTMLAGFLALLARYTGKEDIVIGTSNANRRTREIEGMIGMVVNSLVLRADLAGRPSFREHLARVRELALSTYTHQDMPFERLVQELRFERRPGRNPLFQLMFNFHDAPLPDFDFAGLTLFPEVRGNRTAKMDMNVIVVPRGEQRVGREEDAADHGAVLHWEYNTDLFDLATVERMAAHYQTLLAGAVADPQLALPELPLLTPGERAQVLVGWNDTASDYARESSVPERFGNWAARTPGAPAVVFGAESLTYGELEAESNRLAHHLRGLGIGPGDLVALAVERSLAMIPALLGILKSGASYLPLDPAYPAAAALLHARGQRRPPAAGPGTLARSSALLRAAQGLSRAGSGGDRERSGHGALPAARPWRHRLCDVHLGLDGAAEGGRGHPPEHRPAGLWQRLRALRSGAGVPAAGADLVRRLDPGDLGAAPPRRAPRRLPAGEPVARSAGRGDRPLRSDHPLAHRRPLSPDGRRQSRGSPAARPAHRRRGRPLSRSRAAGSRRSPGAGADQRLRADRGDDLHLLSRAAGAGRSGSDRPHRPADRQCPGLRCRRRAPAAAGRGSRGAADRRRRSGPRLSRPSRADGGALRARPVRPDGGRRAGRPALSHGRPGAPVPGRDPGVPRPSGPAGQDPGLPHRARGDRGGALPAPGGARGNGPGAARTGRDGAPAGRLCGASRGGPGGRFRHRPSPPPRGEPAGPTWCRRPG